MVGCEALAGRAGGLFVDCMVDGRVGGNASCRVRLPRLQPLLFVCSWLVQSVELTSISQSYE